MLRPVSVLVAVAALISGACTGGFPVSNKGGAEEQGAGTGKGKGLQADAATEQPATEPIEIKLWHSYRAAEQEALDQLVDQFNAANASRGVKVKTLMVPFGAYADKITAAIPRDRGPDLFIFAHDRIGDWAESHILEPIQAWVDEDLLDRFFLPTVTALSYGGSLYGLPFAFKTTALFYNKALVPVPPKTTDELIAMVRKLRDPAKGQYGLIWQHATFYFHAAFWYGFGARVFDDAGQPVVNTPEAFASARFVRQFIADGLVPQDASSILITTLFNQGKAAMTINGPWFRGEIEPQVDYGVALLPIISEVGQPAKPYMGSEAIIMSARSKHKELCMEIMRFLTTDDAARVRLLHGKQTVANQAVYADPAVASDPVIVTFMQQLANSVPMGNTPAQRLIWTPMDTALSQTVLGGADPKVSFDRAEELILSYMK